MKLVNLAEEESQIAFAIEAAKHFEQNPKHWTYSSGNIQPGCLLALRWGGSNDCVLVLKIDPDHEPTIYQDMIGG